MGRKNLIGAWLLSATLGIFWCANDKQNTVIDTEKQVFSEKLTELIWCKPKDLLNEDPNLNIIRPNFKNLIDYKAKKEKVNYEEIDIKSCDKLYKDFIVFLNSEKNIVRYWKNYYIILDEKWEDKLKLDLNYIFSWEDIEDVKSKFINYTDRYISEYLLNKKEWTEKEYLYFLEKWEKFAEEKIKSTGLVFDEYEKNLETKEKVYVKWTKYFSKMNLYWININQLTKDNILNWEYITPEILKKFVFETRNLPKEEFLKKTEDLYRKFDFLYKVYSLKVLEESEGNHKKNIKIIEKEIINSTDLTYEEFMKLPINSMYAGLLQ